MAINKRLNLIVSAQDRTGDTFTKVALGVTGINQALEIAKKLAEAAKQAFDFAKEGADLLLVEQRFNRLAESIGSTGDALSKKLDVALKGTMSEMDAMALATDLMSLGLVKTEAEAVRLSGIAADLGMNMNQLVLTLTNQTTMRFDALGIAVDGFKEKVKELEDAGYSADEAFKLAFMEQGEDQIEKVGSVAETAAGEIMQLESAWADWMDSLKKDIAEIVTPTIVEINNVRDAKEWLREAIEKGIVTEEKEREIKQLSMYANISLIDSVNELRNAYNATYDPLIKLGNAQHDLWEEQKKTVGITENMSEAQARSASLEAFIAGDYALAQHYYDVAAGLKAVTDAYGIWIGMQGAQIPASVHLPARPASEKGAPSGGGGDGTYYGWQMFDWSTPADYKYAKSHPKPGYAAGGDFTVPGGGGSDSTNVNFRATPGETVTVGGGVTDNQKILAEMRRLVDSIPTAIADAVERI